MSVQGFTVLKLNMFSAGGVWRVLIILQAILKRFGFNADAYQYFG
ncbi:hypothetical protein [Microbulbifer epialgicus]|uniref:Uncharacterized protein n=1 Tax=Microbulbifer epialgicus TaxID=393907 RepID=A0ABV4P3Y5_9GAMM